MPIDEYAFFQNKLSGMLKSLDDAKHQSADPPDAPALVVASKIYSGQPGRPRLEIDQNFLQHALQHRGPSGLAEIFNCSRRTIRRRALEYGLVVPGEPVYHEIQTDTGTERVFTSTTGPVASLTDSDLDAKIAEILCTFPSFGHRMLKGRLRAMGYNVPASCIASSYIRVHGIPSTFGDRRIERRQYSVPGPLSLVHHDGQHGVLFLSIIICILSSFLFRINSLQNCYPLLH